jgi:hypothetical protein
MESLNILKQVVHREQLGFAGLSFRSFSFYRLWMNMNFHLLSGSDSVPLHFDACEPVSGKQRYGWTCWHHFLGASYLWKVSNSYRTTQYSNLDIDSPNLPFFQNHIYIPQQGSVRSMVNALQRLFSRPVQLLRWIMTGGFANMTNYSEPSFSSFVKKLLNYSLNFGPMKQKNQTQRTVTIIQHIHYKWHDSLIFHVLERTDDYKGLLLGMLVSYSPQIQTIQHCLSSFHT